MLSKTYKQFGHLLISGEGGLHIINIIISKVYVLKFTVGMSTLKNVDGL
jgi:hypothetical protein